MLPGGGNDLTVDGGRALRLAAVVALVVLGLTTLPDLFRTPEPPPIPADVGFRPEEVTAVAAIPRADLTERSAKDSGRAREVAKGTTKAKRKDAEKARSPQPGVRSDGRKRQRGQGARDSGAAGKATTESPASSPAPAVATVPQLPVYVPAPTPPPPDPTPAVPADGSEEFAPGRPG